MKLYFWGTRGSLPTAISEKLIKKKIVDAITKSLKFTLKDKKDVLDFVENHLNFSEKATYGNNTSCVEIIDPELMNKSVPEFVICDAGSGIRDFGNHIIKKGIRPALFHIFISHLHWDHIQGFPFFIPAYNPQNEVHIYGCHHNIQDAFINQQKPVHFPLQLADMPGKIHFHILDMSRVYNIAGLEISMIKQNHPGDAYGYRFQKNDKKVIYSTDSEHTEDAENEDYPFLDFFHSADVLIFDAQYELNSNLDLKKNWGHSNNLIAAEMATKSQVKKLILFHHEHISDDTTLHKMLLDTRKYARLIDKNNPLQIEMAYDGLEVEI